MNFIIQLIVGVALSIASTLWSQANRVEQQKKTGTRGTSQVGGKVPQSFLIGTVGDAGKLVYPRSTWGNDGETPNAYLATVLSFGSLPVSAMTGLFVSSSAVTLSTATSALQGYAVPEYQIDGKHHLWRAFERGVQTVASPYLTAKFGSHPDHPWSSDMIGRGVPYLTVTMRWGEGVWASGAPSIMGQFQGIALYDPRKDSTAGGSGAQRWDSPTTWAFSDNSAVIIYNLLRGVHYGGQHFWGGRCTAAQLPYAIWSAAMDACDENVALNTNPVTYEKRFRGGRKISVNEEPRNVINEFLVGCNGRISYASDGTVYILIGVPSTADGSFTDADVLATEPLGSIPFPRLDEIINGATATYREPLQAWEDKETAPYYRNDLEAEDDGRRQTEGLSLETTFSGTQAQRVLKATVEESRRFGRHVVALPAAYAQYRPLQTLAWTSARFGYAGKLFLITARTRPIWGWVVLGLQEIDPADHTWTPSIDEKPLSFAPVATNRPAPQAVAGPDVASVPGELAYDVFWSAPSVAVDVDFVRVSHRTPGEPSFVTMVPKPTLLTGSARIPVGLDLSGEVIEVQLEYIPGSGRATIASTWMPVMIADVRISPDNLTEELKTLITETIPVDLSAIRERVDVSLPSQYSQDVRALRERLELTINRLAEVASIEAQDRQRIERSVRAEFGAANARFEETLDVQAGTTSALSARTTLLEADLATETDARRAALTSLERAMVDAGTVLGSRLNTIDLALTGYSGESAVANAFSAQSGQISSLGNVVTAQGETISGVELALDGYSGANAVANAFTAQGALIEALEGGFELQAEDVSAIELALTGYLSPNAVANSFSAQSASITDLDDLLTIQAGIVEGLKLAVEDEETGLDALVDTIAGQAARIDHLGDDSVILLGQEVRQVRAELDRTRAAMGELGTINERNRASARAAMGEISRLSEVQIKEVADRLDVTVQDLVLLTAQIDETVATALTSVTAQVSDMDGQMQALAQSINSLEVKTGEVSAGFLLAARLTAAPTGWDGAVQLGMRGDEGGEPSWAGLMIVRKFTGESQVWIDADETIFRGRQRDVAGRGYIDWDTGEERWEV